MAYQAELWACPGTQRSSGCQGYVYLEPGSEAPRCTVPRWLMPSDTEPTPCGHLMFRAGIFELEEVA